MVSFDITSLYTNIPVAETINIICDKIFTNDNLFHNFTRDDFTKILNVILSDTYFLFNNELYKQLDGIPMGNPAAPTLANIFLCNLEENLLNNCNPNFKPLFYNRYLDDTFVIFRNEQQCNSFLEYINNAHPNITFTVERQHDTKLSFLDKTVKSRQ